MKRVTIIFYCLALGFVGGYLAGEANAHADLTKSFQEQKQ